MKYEYKVVIVEEHDKKELDTLLADGWEVYIVTPEVVSSQYYCSGAMFFTLRKEK